MKVEKDVIRNMSKILRLCMFSILFCLSAMSKAEAIDSTIYKKVSYAIENPTYTNVIDAYDLIVKGRSHNIKDKEHSFETIRQYLQNDEIAIEIIAMPKSISQTLYYAFAIRKQYDAPHIVYLFDEKDLDSELNKGSSFFSDTKMSSMLIEPLREELTGVKKIYFTPAKKLHLFAIEYCNVDDRVMLAEKYQLYRLTSSAILTHRRKQRILYDSYAIYGGIDYDAIPEFEEKYDGESMKFQLGYLHDSYLAAIDIDSFLTGEGLHGSFYANEEATELSFKELSQKDIKVFFIETHGVNDSKQSVTPYPNSLMFSSSAYIMSGGIVPPEYEDGLLTSDEIATLNLSSMDLAVISACKSALGDIDWKGVDGLMSAFKTAGVNSLVMVTDDVVDYVSGEVWKSFFRNLIRGMSMRESLLNAIKKTRSSQNGFYSSPKYWTPYILIDGIN